VEDAALVYQALQGEDPADVSTLGVEGQDAVRGLKSGVRGLKLAFAETVFFDDLDPEVERAVRATAEVFRGLGARVDSLEVPEAAEAWAEPNRALFLNAEACVVNRELLDHHLDELDPLVAPRMLSGRKLSAVDYFGVLHHYRALRARLEDTLRGVDALLVPATASPAVPLAGLAEDPDRYVKLHFRLHRNAGLGNILDLCAVALPCGFTAEGLPIGLMVYAPPFREDVALKVAWAFERATMWHTRRPESE